MRTEAGMPKAVVQTTLRLDPAIYAAAQEAAKTAGVSLNEWFAAQIRAALEKGKEQRV